MQAEFDENEIRKQFTYSEQVALADNIMAEERVQAKERMAEGGRSGQLAIPSKEKGAARKFAAQRAGLRSEGTYQRAKEAVTHGIPEVVTAMDKEDIAPYEWGASTSPSRLCRKPLPIQGPLAD